MDIDPKDVQIKYLEQSVKSLLKLLGEAGEILDWCRGYVSGYKHDCSETNLPMIDDFLRKVKPVCPKCGESYKMYKHDDEWVCHNTHVISDIQKD